MEPYLDRFLLTIEKGHRKQDSLLTNEYRYFKYYEELLPENNYMVAVVLFKTQVDKDGNYIHNNFVVTGWLKYIVPKR